MDESVTLKLTRDQKIKMSEALGVICDELILTQIPEDKNYDIDSLKTPTFYAASQTYPIS